MTQFRKLFLIVALLFAVGAHAQTIREGDKANPSTVASSTITVVFPDARTVEFVRQTKVDNDKGTRTWTGTSAAHPGSLLTVVTHRGTVAGSVVIENEAWDIEEQGGRFVLRLSPDEPGEQDVGDAVTTTTTTSGFSTTVAAGDAPLTVDVMVGYTTAARGTLTVAKMEAKIVAAIAASNQALLNSGITEFTFRLTSMPEIAYVETTDIQTSLNDLRGTTDGKMDDVHALRDAAGADIVSLLVKVGNACGIAASMSPVSISFAPRAFNVVKLSCLAQLSLPHEIGHNMGNKHDRANSTGSGAFPYSYGLCRTATDGTGFRTIMAYSCGKSPRVAWFSNPDVMYNGFPTGVSYEVDPANSADNVRSMRNAVATVAAFRDPPIAAARPAAPSTVTTAPTAR